MKPKLIAGAVSGAAAVAGVLTYMNLSSDGSEPELPSEDLRSEFTVRDDAAGLRRFSAPGVRDELVAGVEAGVSGVIEDGTSADAVAVVLERAELLFAPDFDAWRSRAIAADPDNALSIMGDDESYMSRWEGTTGAYSDAAIDPSGVRARRVDPDRGFPETQPGTLCMRRSKDFRVSYPPLEVSPGGADTREMIEVFVPARVRDADGAALGVTLSFVIGRSSPDDAWRELEMFLYAGSDAFGRDILFPAF